MQKKKIPGRLTSQEVCALLGVTPMMLYNYRLGTCKGKTPIPFATKPRGKHRHSVFFVRGEILRWAKRNGISVVI